MLRETDKEMVLSTDGFTLRVTKGGRNVVFASEDYSIKFDYCCWFEVINAYEFWADELMMFTNNVLHNLNGNIVLESNGDNPLLLRKFSMLYIDKNIGNGSFPFNLIDIAYIERPLIREERE